MSRAVVFSDLHVYSHFGLSSRIHDCVKIIDWVFETSHQYDCPFIFFLGDLFHQRNKIDVMSYEMVFRSFYENIQKYHHIERIYLVVGNHDMYYKNKWTVNSIKPFYVMPRVKVIDDIFQETLRGVDICFLPYSESASRTLLHLPKGDLLLSHLAVQGAKLNKHTVSDRIVETDSGMDLVSSENFSSWSKVLLGHYHLAQRLGNVEYVGSPLELNFGEAGDEKHIILLDLNNLSCEYIVNDFSPRHLVIDISELDDEDFSVLENNYVRITYDYSQKSRMLELAKLIPARVNVLYLDFSIKKPKEQEIKEGMSSMQLCLQDILSIMKDYVKESKPDSLDEGKLLSIGEKIVGTAQEK